MTVDECRSWLGTEFEALAPLATEGTGKLIAGMPHRSASDVENTVRQMTAVEWRAAFEH